MGSSCSRPRWSARAGNAPFRGKLAEALKIRVSVVRILPRPSQNSVVLTSTQRLAAAAEFLASRVEAPAAIRLQSVEPWRSPNSCTLALGCTQPAPDIRTLARRPPPNTHKHPTLMLTGELRSQVDAIWNAFWSGGIANPIEVIEQITYLLFQRRLDDLHTLEEIKTIRLGKRIDDPWRDGGRMAVVRVAFPRHQPAGAGGAVPCAKGGENGADDRGDQAEGSGMFRLRGSRQPSAVSR